MHKSKKDIEEDFLLRTHTTTVSRVSLQANGFVGVCAGFSPCLWTCKSDSPPVAKVTHKESRRGRDHTRPISNKRFVGGPFDESHMSLSKV